MLLHLLLKAFAPGQPPIPLLHVDTGWKFREMIAFRDRRAAETGVELRVHTNPDGVRAGHRPDQPRRHGAHRRDEDPGAEAGAGRSTASTPRSAARAATRRSRAPRSACSRSATRSTAGTRRTSVRSCGTCTTRASRTGESVRVFPLSNWTELDVWLYIYREKIPSCRAVLRRASARWSSATAR